MKLPRWAALLLCLTLAQLALGKEDFYNILGLKKDANDKQLKLAYRQLSKKYHPDKNPGDNTAHDKFVEVSEAYEVLSDVDMRKVYDTYGHEGVEQRRNGGNRPHHHDPFELFSKFFGGGGGHAGERRGQNIEIKVEFPLRDFYNGRATEFQWEKQQICDECDGTGAADRHVDVCNACGGHGFKIVKHQLAPGMFQQVQVHCQQCGGRGKMIKHTCPVCGGQRVARKPTTVPIKVDRGAEPDSHVVYENEADEHPDYVAGDLIVLLVEKEPNLEDNPDRVDGAFFRRKGDDLYWKEVLSLGEAMMGDWTRNLTHLDGHIVRLSRKLGEIVQPGHVETVVGEGMPKWAKDGDSVYHKTEFGNLYVDYTVIIPDQMDAAMRDDYWAVIRKWRGKHAVDLHRDSGRPDKPVMHEEL